MNMGHALQEKSCLQDHCSALPHQSCLQSGCEHLYMSKLFVSITLCQTRIQSEYTVKGGLMAGK